MICSRSIAATCRYPGRASPKRLLLMVWWAAVGLIGLEYTQVTW